MCRTVLAWREVRDGILNGAINATMQERDQVEAQERQSERILAGIVSEGFRYLIVPAPKGANDVDFEVRKMQIAASETLGEVVMRTLEQNEDIVRRWAPMFMKSVLESLYFKGDVTEISTLRLWQDMASFYNFPRVVTTAAFCDTVSEGASAKMFGYARAKADDGTYLDFAYGSSPGVTGISESELLIKNVAADAYQNRPTPTPDDSDEPIEPVDPVGPDNPPIDPIEPVDPTNPPGPPPIDPPVVPTAAKRKFVGSVSVDLSENTAELRQVLEEVLVHMSGKGLRLTVQLDINATCNNPIKSDIVRTVSENANTLGFSRAEFC